MLEVNFTRALALLRAVVAQFGENHAAGSSCIYFEENSDGTLTPVCIVGQVFARLGILRALYRGGLNISDTAEHGTDNNFAACFTDSAIWSRAEAFGVRFSDDAKALLREAQGNQDSSMQWGESVNLAVETRERVAREEAMNTLRELRDKLLNESEVIVSLDERDEPLADWERELLKG